MKVQAIFLFAANGVLSAAEPEPPGLEHLVAVKDVCAWPALTLLPDGSINATLCSTR